VTAEAVRVRLLGPVDVTVGGAVRPLSGLRRKTALAVMALHPGEVVSADRLVDIVWGERPPATSAKALQNNMSHLRGVLGDTGRIVASARGYLLDLPPESIDVGRAESLIRHGGAADQAETAVRLRSALDLWRGRSLSDVSDESGAGWLGEQAVRLENLRMDAAQSLLDARLALGEHAQLLPQLEHLIEQHPFRENLYRQLMLALYRCGRQADALAAYRRLRVTLSQELGIDPGPAVRELEAAILRQDASLDLPSPTVTLRPGSDRHTPPAQLPLAARTFTGRDVELAQLSDMAAASGSPAVAIITVSGTAGVGKTALTVHWAHREAARFPDGQLYVNLRGFDPAGAAMTPGEAVRGFLSALRVPAKQIPVSLDAQATLLRSLLATRRVLMVLDNARDEEQVRPLLPAAPECVVVVTSRHRLGGLVATEGARALTLRLPATAAAREMLSRRLGAERVAAETEAVDDIIATCAHLPLALAVAAAHPAAAPEFPLEYLAGRLRDADAALDPFQNADKATDVRAVFSTSYQALSPGAARLFRYLGLCPGPDISLAAAASLAGLPRHEMQPLLSELVLMHLLTEATPGRYSYHDLLRAYAMEQAHRLDSPEQRANALHRVLDHYLHTAISATRLLVPNQDPIVLDPIQPGVTVTALADKAQAMAWFDTEQTLLYAAVELARDIDDWRPWQLIWAMFPFIHRRARWHDNTAVYNAVLEAAERVGDARGQAHAHYFLGQLKNTLGRFAEAEEHRQRAIALFDAIGDFTSRGRVHISAAVAAQRQGNGEDSLREAQRALLYHRKGNSLRGQGYALNTIGWSRMLLGELESARDYCEQAVAIYRQIDELPGLAGTLDTLAVVHFRLGNVARAVDYCQQAIAACRKTGDVLNEATVFDHLGDGYAAAGDTAAARRSWHQAMTRLSDVDHPLAAEVRAKIEAVPA